MKVTRASIDRTLDRLSVETAVIRQEAVRRGLASVMFAAAALLTFAWWRRPRVYVRYSRPPLSDAWI
jgi:hypothetical protein